MVLGRVASANTACSKRRVCTKCRSRCNCGLSSACRFALTSLADQPAVVLPSTNVAVARPAPTSVMSALVRASAMARIIGAPTCITRFLLTNIPWGEQDRSDQCQRAGTPVGRDNGKADAQVVGGYRRGHARRGLDWRRGAGAQEPCTAGPGGYWDCDLHTRRRWRDLPHRRWPPRPAHSVLPGPGLDARASPGRRTIDRAWVVGRGFGAFPPSHGGALRPHGEIH